MACLYANCKVKNNSDQQFLCCWLCDAQAHWSCAGFNGRTFDVIVDRSKGLRWSCLNCRDLDVDFYRMFRDAKLVLSRLKSDFEAVSCKFDEMNSLFDKFEYVDNSPKRKKSTLNLDNRANSLSSASNLISLLSPVVNFSKEGVPTVIESGPPVENASSDSGGSEITPLSAEVENVSVPNSNASTDVPVVTQGNDISCSISSLPPQNTGNNNLHGLVVVPPRRTVFISRLSPHTSVEEIGNYIKSIRPDIGEVISVFKFNYSQPRDISSFKIIVPGEFFDNVVSSAFWPDGVLVREFVHRDRIRVGSVVQLSSSAAVSKN